MSFLVGIQSNWSRDGLSHSFRMQYAGMRVCGMRTRAFCSVATEVFGYAAIWLWAAFEPHNFQTRICAHFNA
jgi:hypothetical protein